MTSVLLDISEDFNELLYCTEKADYLNLIQPQIPALTNIQEYKGITDDHAIRTGEFHLNGKRSDPIYDPVILAHSRPDYYFDARVDTTLNTAMDNTLNDVAGKLVRNFDLHFNQNPQVSKSQEVIGYIF
jgi:hypothetical protein